MRAELDSTPWAKGRRRDTQMLGLWSPGMTKWTLIPGQETSVRSPEKQGATRQSKEDF